MGYSRGLADPLSAGFLGIWLNQLEALS
jgi:hypothetical protein